MHSTVKLLFQMQQTKATQNKQDNSKLPPVSPEIMRIASERHQKGFMHPWIYQLLSQVGHMIGHMTLPPVSPVTW